jgi:sigma-E factor negative regulatory protein RseC
METPQGRIIHLYADAEPPHAVVEVVSSVSCARCAAGKGCGAGLLAGDERLRKVDARIKDRLELREGDRVSITLRPDDLLEAAVSAYGMPLFGGLAAAGGAHLAGLGDLPAAAVTLLGLFAGAVLGRRRLRRKDCLRRFTPVVTARLEGG